MLQVERALQVECQYANVETVEEIMGTAAALWDEMNEIESSRRNAVLPEANGSPSRGRRQQQPPPQRQLQPQQQPQQQQRQLYAAQYETPQRNPQQWRGRASQMVTPQQGRPIPNTPAMQSDPSGRLIAYIPHNNTPQQSDFQNLANLSQWDAFF